MTESRKQEAGRRDAARKPHRPADEPPVEPLDPVEEASRESFPASDPPAHTRSERERMAEEQKRRR